jgi:ADP-heptose:LPS heptosyltransferase
MSSENRLFYEYAYVTFGIGDFIAFESFLTDKEKASLKEIIIFGNKNHSNETRCSLIKNNIFYNKKIKITIIPKPNMEIIGFTRERASLLRSHMSNNLHLANNKYKMLVDYRFYNQNDQYKKIIENQNFKNYSFVKQKLCEVDKFKLPQQYISISAWTRDNPNSKRLFYIEDWHETMKILKSNNIKGIILNNQKLYLDNLWVQEILKEDCFINLTGETNYLEAIEIVKNSKGFIGIDGSLSIIATQALQEKSIIIKANNYSGAHRLFNYYYSNLKTKDCLVEQIKLNKFNI